MFWKKRASEPLDLNNILVKKNLSEEERKQYNKLLTDMQKFLLNRENALSRLKGDLQQKENQLLFVEQQTGEYEEKRASEKKDCAERFEKESEELASGLKKQRRKNKIRKWAGNILLIAMLAAAAIYYFKVDAPAIQTANMEYEKSEQENIAGWEQKLQEREKELESELSELQKELDTMLEQQQQTWDSDISALEAQKSQLQKKNSSPD